MKIVTPDATLIITNQKCFCGTTTTHFCAGCLEAFCKKHIIRRCLKGGWDQPNHKRRKL